MLQWMEQYRADSWPEQSESYPLKRLVWEHSGSRLLLRLTLLSEQRDPINAFTPDVLIAYKGGPGTLCELAYAALANKPVFLCDGRSVFKTKYDQHNTPPGRLGDVLKIAHAAYPSLQGKAFTIDVLTSSLQQLLNDAEDCSTCSAAEVVSKALAKLPSDLGMTGFPGLSNDPTSKATFERIVLEISQFTEESAKP